MNTKYQVKVTLCGGDGSQQGHAPRRTDGGADRRVPNGGDVGRLRPPPPDRDALRRPSGHVESHRDQSSKTPTPKRTTPLKIAGEVQMKALSHDMGILRRENERLKSDRARLIEALQDAISATEGSPTHGSVAINARAILARVRDKP